MEALKLKIFEVLTEKINVSEFENWLYNSEEFLGKINSNSFYFDIISIDFRNEDWCSKLNNLAKEYFNNDCLEILRIKISCLNILKSESFVEIDSILTDLTQRFDYDTDYTIMWTFYTLNDYFGLVKEGLWKLGTLQTEVKFYATQFLEIIQEKRNFDELKTTLETELKPFKND